jgi:hypothetical protein
VTIRRAGDGRVAFRLWNDQTPTQHRRSFLTLPRGSVTAVGSSLWKDDVSTLVDFRAEIRALRSRPDCGNHGNRCRSRPEGRRAWAGAEVSGSISPRQTTGADLCASWVELQIYICVGVYIYISHI